MRMGDWNEGDSYDPTKIKLLAIIATADIDIALMVKAHCSQHSIKTCLKKRAATTSCGGPIALKGMPIAYPPHSHSSPVTPCILLSLVCCRAVGGER